MQYLFFSAILGCQIIIIVLLWKLILPTDFSKEDTEVKEATNEIKDARKRIPQKK